MALAHSNAVKAAATDAATALFALKNTAAPDGVKIDLMKSDDTVLVTLVFSGTGSAGTNGFGAANGTTGIATAVTINNGTVTVAGVAAKFKIYNLTNAYTLTGSVSESGGGGDIILNNTDLVVDQIVQITSMTYRALPA